MFINIKPQCRCLRAETRGVKVRSVVSCFFLLAACGLLSACNVYASEKTIGVIMTGNIPYYNRMHNAFLQRLKKEGYLEIVKVLIQKPYPETISLSNAARKMSAADADIIVTYGAPATSAAINEGAKVPIVYGGVYAPGAIEIPQGMSVTGSISKVPLPSLLRYLRGINTIGNLGVVFSAADKDSVKQLEELDKLGAETGFKITKINLKNAGDFIRTTVRADAIFVTSSSVANMAIGDIVMWARQERKPVVSMLSGFEDAGVIMSMSANPEKKGENLADKVIKIIRGTPPGRIPVDSNTDVEIIFNMKETTSLGLKLPLEAIGEATKVIY